ncbi:queuosine precursor transporter [Candidatus Falkowbacteria bacterium]|nr:queuosine precursor transporter [Candidatus Falkowbacteria bacterium]
MKISTKINIPLLSSSLYVATQIFANILSTKITVLPILNLAVDGGTIIYPLTFTLRDFVHKTWGKNNARQTVIIAAGLNALMFVLFWLVGKMTSDPAWKFQEAYELILLPVGRIVMASIIAQIISELIDTEIFSAIYKKIGDLSAVFISNFISLTIDSFIFGLIAFLGSLPLATVLQIILANILLKLIISALSAPVIKLVPRLVNFEEI